MGFFKNIRQCADFVLQQKNVACAELRKHAVGICFIHSPVGAAEKQNGVLCLSADLNDGVPARTSAMDWFNPLPPGNTVRLSL